MKKLAISIVAGVAIAFTPFSSFALSPMSADGLKDATGQAGVSIAIDGVKIESYIGAVTYTDADGSDTLIDTVANALTGGANGTDASTSITIGNKHKVQYINAIIGSRVADGDLGTISDTSKAIMALDGRDLTNDNYTYFNSVAGSAKAFETRALTIDVGTCDLLTAGHSSNLVSGIAEFEALNTTASGLGTTVSTQIAGVVIGLPTLEIYTAEDSYDVSINQSGALNDGMKFIKITKEASSMAILSGTLEIAAH